MDVNKLAQSAIAAAKAIAPLVPGGGAAVAAAEAIIAVVKEATASDDLTVTNIVELDEQRLALEKAVNAHADRTADKLADPS